MSLPLMLLCKSTVLGGLLEHCGNFFHNTKNLHLKSISLTTYDLSTHDATFVHMKLHNVQHILNEK